MDKEKEEGLLGIISDAAKTSMDAALEGVSSAANAITEAVTGKTEKPRRRRKTTKKPAVPSRGRTARAKAKRTAGGRKSATGTGRKAIKKSAAKRRPSSAAATRGSAQNTTKSRRKSFQPKRGTTKARPK
jgi:hypothetical protein